MRRFGHRTTGIAKSRGFTLIELMIVLAIIGVLVTAGVPYLQNYLVRARVVEGLGVAASAKALVSENAMHGAPFNSGWQAPSATDNVNSVSIDSVSGNVTIAYTQRAGDGAIVLVPTSAGADGAPKALTAGKAPEGQIVGRVTHKAVKARRTVRRCRPKWHRRSAAALRPRGPDSDSQAVVARHPSLCARPSETTDSLTAYSRASGMKWLPPGRPFFVMLAHLPTGALHGGDLVSSFASLDDRAHGSPDLGLAL